MRIILTWALSVFISWWIIIQAVGYIITKMQLIAANAVH